MQQEYQIDAFRRVCRDCGRRFEPLEEYVSVLRDAETVAAAQNTDTSGETEKPAEEAGDAMDNSAVKSAEDATVAATGEASSADAAGGNEAADEVAKAGKSPAGKESAGEKKPRQGAGYGLVREDYCPDCAPSDCSAAVAVWRSKVSPPEEPRKRGLVIDDQRLLEVFFRLDGTDDPARLDFRYVIGLMLIRKRKLKMEGTRQRAGGIQVMRVRKTRSKQFHDLVDRHLADAAIIQVSQDIGELLDLIDSDAAEAPAAGPETACQESAN